MRRRLTGLTALHWRHLDGDWVAYDEGSGQTLALDRVAAAALMALEGGCALDADIEARVRDDLGLAADDLLAERLAEALDFLTQVGLVDSESK